MTWTPEATATLRLMHEDGYSFSQIGAVVGMSKNSCIGKAHRLHLDKRRDPTLPGPRERPRLKRIRKPRPPRPKVARPTPTPTVEPVALGVTLMELRDGQCKWPLGDGPYLFCGHWRPYNVVYCAYHAKLAGRQYDSRHRQPRFGLYAKVA